MLKKTLSIMTCFALVSLILFSANYHTTSANTTLIENKMNEDAVKLYQKIINFIEENKEIGYSGAYIDEKNILNVGLVGKENKYKEELKDLAGDIPIEFFNGKHTLKKLDKVMKDFLELDTVDWNQLGITSLDVSEKKNKLIIGLKSIENKKFQDIILSNIKLEVEDVVFVKKDPVVVQSRTDNQTVKQGGIRLTGLNSKGALEESTLGFAAKDKTGKYGIVMSGHPVKGVGTWVSQGSSIGQVTTDPCCNRNSDAAFVKTSAGVQVAGRVYGGYLINNYYGWWYIPEGAKVLKHGISTGVTEGYITNREVTVIFETGYKYNSGRMYKLVEASYSSDEGDSGGTITAPINGSGYVQLYGIHVGEDDNLGYYSPVDIILDELNLERPLLTSDGNVSN
jgi:hypothetical protein